jgi:hypothetical protein
MKLEFIAQPTERTTAGTDVLMGLLAALAGFIVRQSGAGEKVALWLWLFGLVAFSSLLGAAAHGFKMSARVNYWIWQPLNLTLGLTVALFAAAVVLDLWGAALALALLPYFVAAGVVFYLITVIKPGTFIFFVIYEMIAMLFALGGYGWLALSGAMPGAGWLAAGILIMIVAAVVQALQRARVSFIWEFDHNGVFHILQMIGLVLITIGLLQTL